MYPNAPTRLRQNKSIRFFKCMYVYIIDSLYSLKLKRRWIRITLIVKVTCSRLRQKESYVYFGSGYVKYFANILFIFHLSFEQYSICYHTLVNKKRNSNRPTPGCVCVCLLKVGLKTVFPIDQADVPFTLRDAFLPLRMVPL